MSVRVSSWVWHSKACSEISGNELVLLAALADVADDEGWCRYATGSTLELSYAALARKVRVSRRTIIRLVASLQEAGLVSLEAGARGRQNVFRLAVPWASDEGSEGLEDDDLTGDKLAPSRSGKGAKVAPSRADSVPTEARFGANPGSRSYIANEVTGEGASRRASASTGSRISEGWEPSPAGIAYAAEKAPSVDVEAEAEAFRDYWISVAGAKGRKADWDATWRTWVRRSHTDAVRRGWKPPASGPTSRMRDAGAELRERQKREFLEARGISEREWDAMSVEQRREVAARA